MQPAGYVPALGFLDQARFFRYQFRRLGARVSIGKNRLRHDAINFVFGAHLGFDVQLKQRFRCVFVNLEQLGNGGAEMEPAYLHLLSTSPAIDYDESNVAAYRPNGHVPIATFAYAPYLSEDQDTLLEERPIDVLFFGSVNERRQGMLQQIEAAGCNVSVLQFGLFGTERDQYIRQAKAVFNCHFYESARFEQARAFHCLSLGTPLISERTARAHPPSQFEESVFWLAGIREFFENDFKTSAFYDSARKKLRNFARYDVLSQYAAALKEAVEFFDCQGAPAAPWRPDRLHIGSGKDYMPGWFNVDILETAEPDALLDLSKPVELPIRLNCATVGQVELMAESVQWICANNVLEHVRDLPQLMTNCLRLMKREGQMVIDVPYEHAPGAWQDPTHVRAFNENSWIYYTDWFWYLGWFEARFVLHTFEYLDEKLRETTREEAHFMRIRLRKVLTTPAERSIARTMRADFGGLPDDVSSLEINY